MSQADQKTQAKASHLASKFGGGALAKQAAQRVRDERFEPGTTYICVFLDQTLPVDVTLHLQALQSRVAAAATSAHAASAPAHAAEAALLQEALGGPGPSHGCGATPPHVDGASANAGQNGTHGWASVQPAADGHRRLNSGRAARAPSSSAAGGSAGSGAGGGAGGGGGDMDEVLGVMEALGQPPALCAAQDEAGAGSSQGGPAAPAPSASSPVRPARRRAGAAASPAGAVAGAGGASGEEGAFYQSWRVRRHRPSSPDYRYSQPASEGAMVRWASWDHWSHSSRVWAVGGDPSLLLPAAQLAEGLPACSDLHACCTTNRAGAREAARVELRRGAPGAGTGALPAHGAAE